MTSLVRDLGGLCELFLRHFRFLLWSHLLSAGRLRPVTVALSSATDVVTYHIDINRSGHNMQETILTFNSVNSSGFGKLFTIPIDGVIDAEPYVFSGSVDFGHNA